MDILRLHANHPDSRVDGFDGHGDTGNQTTTANRHYDVVHIIEILDDFQANGALTGNHFCIVEGGDKYAAFHFHDFADFGNGVIETIAMQNNFRRIIAGCSNF